MDIHKKLAKARKEKKEYRKLLNRLKSLKPSKADHLFQEQHKQVFQTVDCLACANCCKTTSPMFSQNDISRIGKCLRMKPGDVIDQYLQLDDEGDYVLKSSPCTFLGEDNYCSIYEARPKACREYPHTDRKKIQKLFPITEKNLLICPAVVGWVGGRKE